MADDEVRPIRQHLERISARIIDPQRPGVHGCWARSVGPVYMSKSRRSWAKVIARGADGLLTVAKWAAWNCKPNDVALATWQLAAGSCVVDPPLSSRRGRTVPSDPWEP